MDDALVLVANFDEPWADEGEDAADTFEVEPVRWPEDVPGLGGLVPLEVEVVLERVLHIEGVIDTDLDLGIGIRDGDGERRPRDGFGGREKRAEKG